VTLENVTASLPASLGRWIDIGSLDGVILL
jgi:hypothetical protein